MANCSHRSACPSKERLCSGRKAAVWRYSEAMARYRRTFSRTALPLMIILPVLSLGVNVAEAIFQIVSARRRWPEWFPDRKAAIIPARRRRVRPLTFHHFDPKRMPSLIGLRHLLR